LKEESVVFYRTFDKEPFSFYWFYVSLLVMQRIFKILQANYVIAIFLTLLAYVFYPPISKYVWTQKLTGNSAQKIDFYVDVDGNKEKEYLSISAHNESYGSVTLYDKDNMLLGVLNLNYSFIVNRPENIVLEYVNDNKAIDLSLLGVRNDSLFLIKFEYDYGVRIQPSMKTYFLDHLKQFNGKIGIISTMKTADMDGDGIKDIVVQVSAGFSILPRRIYIVNVQKDEILRSPISGIYIGGFVIDDLNQDGKKEILLNTAATCNIYDEIFTPSRINNSIHDSLLKSHENVLREFGDCSAWLVVLTNRLEYLFPPMEIEGWTGNLQSKLCTVEDEKAILSVYSNYKDSTMKPRMLIHRYNGELIKDVEIQVNKKIHPPINLFKKENQYYFTDAENLVYEIKEDGTFLEADKEDLPLINTNVVYSNIDKGELSIKVSENYIEVYNSDMILLQEFFIPNVRKKFCYTSLKENNNITETILINTDSYHVELKMEPNIFHMFRFVIWLVIYLGIWLLLLLAKRLFSYRAIQEKQRFERIVEERTEEVLKQKDDLKKLTVELKDKNEMVYQQNQELKRRRAEIESLFDKLTSSITYGKGIKDALLPSSQHFKSVFPEHFMFFRPKNVVGGDFYWLGEKDNRRILIVGDASGQGVSGAFLSLLVISVLNDIRVSKISDASKILKSVNAVIYKHFASYLKNNDDGIEMAVVILDDEKDVVNVQFSSANIPLYYFESDTILDMKVLEPNDFRIRADVNSLSFANQEIQIKKKSMLYLGTKGFSNQIDSLKQEPFGKVQMKSNLMRVNVLPIEEQKQIIMEKFDKWQGINEQTDDVLFIGVRV